MQRVLQQESAGDTCRNAETTKKYPGASAACDVADYVRSLLGDPSSPPRPEGSDLGDPLTAAAATEGVYGSGE